jgi:propionate CoA-transferase
VSQPVLYITERAVFELSAAGVVLIEIAPGIDLQRDVLDQMDFAPIISPELTTMDSRIFSDGAMYLSDLTPVSALTRDNDDNDDDPLELVAVR